MHSDTTTNSSQVNTSNSKTKHIFRVQRNKDFVTINRTCLEDERLSLKAKGLHCLMLAQSDDWVFYLDDLVGRSKDGKDGVRSALKELQESGYINKYSERDKNGRIVRWVTDVYEYPQPKLVTTQVITCGKKPKTTIGLSTTGFSTTGKSDPNKNNNNKNNNNKNNNVVEEAIIVDLEIEKEIGKRLGKLATAGLIAGDDRARLLTEAYYHVTHRLAHMSVKHALNAVIAMIKGGKWSTPKGMIKKEIDQRETKLENDKMRERNQALASGLTQMLANKMRAQNGF